MVVVPMVPVIVILGVVVKVIVWDPDATLDIDLFMDALGGVMLRVPTGIDIEVFAGVNSKVFAVVAVLAFPPLKGFSR